MSENETNVEQVNTPETNYLDVINELRKNTVSKADYERVMSDNRMLAEQLAYSTPSATAQEEEHIPTTEEVQNLRSHLFNTSGISNLDYIRTALDLRDAVMKQGERDPFLPTNNGYIDNDVDKARVEAMAKGLRQMVDYCGNDKKLFDSELKRCCR